MNLLVTGACGFIGSFVAKQLAAEGHKVIALDVLTYAADVNRLRTERSSGIKLYVKSICDVTDVTDICKEHKIDKIINFAAHTHVDNSIKDASSFVFSNVLGVQSLLDVCRDLKLSMIHISTDEVYGPAHNAPFKETDRFSPMNPYSATKVAGEHLIQAYRNTFGVDVVILRPSNVFGPMQHREKFIPTVIRNIKAGTPVPLYGDGKHERDWTHVSQIARAVSFCLSKNLSNDVFNVTAGSIYQNIDMVWQIAEILFGHELDFEKIYNQLVTFVPDRLGHDRKYWIDGSKLAAKGFFVEDEIGDFENFLRRTVLSY